MMRHATKLLLALALIALLVAPASAWNIFNHGTKGNGDLTTTTYDLDRCDKILLECGLDIRVTFGDQQSIELTMDENLVELYDLDVRGGTLVIDADKNPRPNKKARLDLVLTDLTRLKVEGAGDIEVVDYDGETLELIVEGAGDIEIDGRVDSLDIEVDGAGDIDTRHLKAHDAEVTVNGAGDVDVFADRSADVTINGVGDIDVYGQPEQFTKSVNGIGDIDRK